MPTTYLALDIGTKRIGVAVGSLMPFGRGVIDATNDKNVLDKLKQLIVEERISEIVIGLPEVKSGDTTDLHKKIYAWRDVLIERFHLPVHLINEAFSSVEAERQLREMHIDTRKEKWRIDERSAELLLAQFLVEQKQ